MDAKELQLIRELIRRIEARQFHERDVLALLILLRAHAPAQSPMRELGDFVAHREKDRGALKAYVQHVVAYGEALRSNTQAELKINPIHSAQDFSASLGAVLKTVGVRPLSQGVTKDVFVCAMSLLQDVRLYHNGTAIGGLALARLGTDLWLCGVVVMPPKGARVVFPALIASNTYCSRTEAYEPFEGIVEARCLKGHLRLFVDRKKVS